jgi:hypothetical protein
LRAFSMSNDLINSDFLDKKVRIRGHFARAAIDCLELALSWSIVRYTFRR